MSLDDYCTSFEKKHLYKKVYPIGVIDDSEENPIYYFTSEWNQLRAEFQALPFPELVFKLVSIFQEGIPEYMRLMELFGTDISSELVDEKKRIYCSNVECGQDDIYKVEMRLDEQGVKINELYLFVRELPDMNNVRTFLKGNYDDVNISMIDNLVVLDMDCKIVLQN
ncbi:hypothetical protein LIT25_00970 [Bacillus sp. F19]|nr:hypothetical protein LIT25_00970 [Bacillus sp. F19]